MNHLYTKIILISIFNTSSIFAQKYIVSGYIVDQETGETVIGANVIVKGAEIGSATDGNGFFRISGLISGKYTLLISHIAYESKEIEIDIENRSLILQAVSIKKRALEFQNIVVTGKKFELLDPEVETSTRENTRKAIRSIPTSRQDVFRAIKFLPGIDQVDPLSPLYVVRGGDPGENLFLLDGSTISITPTGNLPTQPIIVTQTDPVTLGVPFPENALDLAFTIETDGTLSDPITIKIEWDFPEPTPPTSGSPTLIVNHGDGWNNHPVDAWDYTAPPYWVEFSTGQLSDWVIGEGDDNPLPVTLSAFTGLCYEGIPTLNWTTQSETDNLGWNIFRSLSENGWNSGEIFQINSNLIAGQGTTTEITTYTYQDIYDILQNVEYHYWLQSISLGGDIGIYGPVSVLVELEEEPIIVPELPVTTFMNHNYPNPFNPQTTIEFGIKEGETGTFAIYNLRGQKIMSQNFAEGYHTYHWNAEKLSSGIYFYVLKTFSYREVKRMILLK